MAHKKLFLAKKYCSVCERPFSWRKRWQSCWDQVKYCSKRCAKAKKGTDI
ncbi:DUF2256 domain-containing protein [Marinagarivorans cellulosilyticus]|nr:DUF2256 domain-containing protein [Marinagarivorans cellulosilyticus]